MMAQLELVHPMPEAALEPRPDHLAISLMVREGAKVLDVGCGDGGLISLLARARASKARGLEVDQRKVNACVSRGLSVVQADAERDLAEYPSGAFDYVILSHTLQSLRRPHVVLKQAARVGERVIVSIANAAHWRARLSLLGGRVLNDDGVMHPMSVRDFVAVTRGLRLGLERATPLSGGNPGAPFAKTLWRANWFAEEAVFELSP